MEYQSQNGNGQFQWYTLVGESAIPEKVRIVVSGNLVISTS